MMAMMLFLACAETIRPTPLTPLQQAKQQLTTWNNIYVAQYKDTESMLTIGSPAQKAMGMKKKEILIKVQPLLKLANDVVANGGVPTAQNMDNLNILINQLTATITGG